MKSPKSFREFMMQDFVDRKSQNPMYSMRAYARDLGVSTGLVSQVFSGKRKISLKMGEKIARQMRLQPAAKRLFLSSLVTGLGRNEADILDDNVFLVSNDHYHLIADWYHWAILSLARLDNAQGDVHWIASRLGITACEAELAVARLRRLKLVQVTGSKLVRTGHKLLTPPDVPSSAAKKSHRQTLEQTIECLTTVPLDRREISSTTVATSPEKIAYAKVLMREFADTISHYLEDGPKTEVYNVNLQLVPVTKITN